MASHKVLIRRCPDYQDLERIRKIVAGGMETLGAKPGGKVLVKYNMVFAHHRMGRFAYTHPRVLEAVVDELVSKPSVEKVILAERTGVYVPTRYHFMKAGYSCLAKKPKVEVCFFDEDKKVEVKLEKAGFHKTIRLSKTLMDADYKVYVPKLKHHVTTRLTCALKLNIGICDQKERLHGHDHRLEEKIADLYEPGCPDLVVVDAIDIGQKNEIFPEPLRLGALMAGASGVAVDSIAARIIGFEPDDIEHLKIARSRGWEPVSDQDIEIDTDMPWEEIREKTKNFDYSFGDLSEIETPIRFFLGARPRGAEPCWGGCINMLKGALAGFDAYRKGCLARARPVAMVMGEYQGDVDGLGHPVLLVGDCSKVLGKVKGRTRRIRGCPVGIPVFTVLAPYFLRIPSPLLGEHPKEAYLYGMSALVAKCKQLKNRL